MSVKIYDLKYKNITVGRFSETNGHVTYVPVDIGKVTELKRFQRYPIGLYPIDVIKSDNLNDWPPTEDNILNWLQERIFPKERQNGISLLSGLGLKEYNVWEIIKKTRALSDNDSYWITPDPNEKYEEVLRRNSAEGTLPAGDPIASEVTRATSSVLTSKILEKFRPKSGPTIVIPETTKSSNAFRNVAKDVEENK